MSKKKLEGEKTKPKKRGWKICLVSFLVLAIIGVGGFFLYKFISRPQVSTETVKIENDSRDFSVYFKNYVSNRLRYKYLTSEKFRDLTSEEILEELATLKEGFSKVSKGVGTSFEDSEFEEMAEILANDTTVFLKTIREMRAIEAKNYDNDADKQLDFMKAVEGGEDQLRSGLYLSRGAFDEEKSGLSTEGILIFEGDIVTEVGGGVMNILVGDVEQNVTATTLSDLNETVRKINAEKMFGFKDGKMVLVGQGLREAIELSKLIEIKLEMKQGEAEKTITKVSLVGKSTWGLKSRLNEYGIQGLLEQGNEGTTEVLRETIQILSGETAVEK